MLNNVHAPHKNISSTHAKNMRRLLISCLLAIAPVTAFAVPITWYVSGVTFNDGGTLSGSFVYDANTLQVSDVDLLSTGGTSFGGTHYAFSWPTAFTTFIFYSGPLDGNQLNDYALGLTTAGVLTNAGGTVALTSSNAVEVDCGNATCTANSLLRTHSGGLVTTVAPIAVPEPGTLALFGLGIAGLGLMRRRRKI